MKKTTQEIEKTIKDVDFIIEVIDARAIFSSSNKDLQPILQKKPSFQLALKSDLTTFDKKKVDFNSQILYASIYKQSDKNLIISKIKQICSQIIEKKTRQGYKEIKLYGIVIGLPNIGKSSLINYLSSKTKAIAENKPGVTKKLTWIKVEKDLFLLDTPGVFIKNIDNNQSGYKLVLINCIKQNVVNIDLVLEYAYQYLGKYFLNDMKRNFDYSKNDSFQDFIKRICIRYNFIISNNELDYEKGKNFFLNYLNSKKMFKVNYDVDL